MKSLKQKKKVLFIDRDGTIIHEPQEDKQVDSLEKLEFLPQVITVLSKIARNLDYELVMITNQDGLGTDSFPEDSFWPAHNKMLTILANEGIRFSQIHIDRSFEHENLDTRKPGTGLLKGYFTEEYDLENSFVIGDRWSDMQLANNLNAGGIFYGSPEPFQESAGLPVKLAANDWEQIYAFLITQNGRKAEVSRKTKETDIYVYVNLDGIGTCRIKTGLSFFDHMLEQLGKHSKSDLTVQVEGDLHIDEHHTIEDTALAIGEAFGKALGDKKGIERYGFMLPMDDCLAQAAIDFSGRPWLVWEASFKREHVGDMPTEMFYHFFKSFSDMAKCNLNIKAEGQNEHHKIEAIFKSVAKAIKMAKRKDPDSKEIPSTKGTL